MRTDTGQRHRDKRQQISQVLDYVVKQEKNGGCSATQIQYGMGLNFYESRDIRNVLLNGEFIYRHFNRHYYPTAKGKRLSRKMLKISRMIDFDKKCNDNNKEVTLL